MTMSLDWRRGALARLFNFANNPLTIAGVVLTTLSGLMLVVFIAMQAFGGLRNPYVGIFAYLVLPAIFILGLVLIPVGMWRRRRKLISSGATAEEMETFPRLDFNDPALRRVMWTVIGLTALNATLIGASSFFAVHEMETVSFCGTTCHTVMQPEYTAYQESPHSRVACVDCHIGPGASWFVKSKLDGLRQVWHTALNTYHRPIMTPLRTLRPARETCEQCHWPTKHHGDKLVTLARFSEDEANTPAYSAMLLKTGGGSLDAGQHGGIHWWHIEADNRIRYVASDERRQEIAWVELRLPDGSTRAYSRPDAKLPTPAELESRARVMDCIDCHNRPTHRFPTPEKAMDDVLENHPELRALHYYKKVAVAAIKGTYATREAGMAAVRDAVMSAYREGGTPGPAADPALVPGAADQAAEVYGSIVFPQMDTNWSTHPNDIGHDDFPGCWRCHDDEMATSDGKHVIPQDCETCHVFIAEDSPTPPNLAGALGG
jgi:nitrate/TMAO reductase-like tetraheme cytochrome c subunit